MTEEVSNASGEEVSNESIMHISDDGSAEMSVEDIISSSGIKSKWYYQEGKQGEGDKPDFLLDDYGNNIYEQAKAAKDLKARSDNLRRQLGEKGPGAPEEYALNINEEYKDYGIDENDSMLISFAEKAHEYNLPQNAFDDILNNYLANIDQVKNSVSESSEEENKKYYEEQIKELGENSSERITRVHDWLNTYMGPELSSNVTNSITSSSQIVAFENLISNITKSPIPSGKISDSQGPTTHEELLKMVSDPMTWRSEDLRKKMEDGYRNLNKNV